MIDFVPGIRVHLLGFTFGAMNESSQGQEGAHQHCVLCQCACAQNLVGILHSLFGEQEQKPDQDLRRLEAQTHQSGPVSVYQ